MSHTVTALLLIVSLAGNVAWLSQSLLSPAAPDAFAEDVAPTAQTAAKVTRSSMASCQPHDAPSTIAVASQKPVNPVSTDSHNQLDASPNTVNVHTLTANGTQLLTTAQQAKLAKQLQSDPSQVDDLLNAISNHQLSEQIRSQLVGIVASQDSPRLFDRATALMQENQPDSQRLGSELANRLIRHAHSVERTARLLNNTSLPQPALRQILRSSALLPLAESDKQNMHEVLANYMNYADTQLQPDILTSLARLSANDEQRLTTLTPYLTSSQPALQNAAINALYQQQHGVSPNSQAYVLLESLANDQSVAASVRSAALALLANTSS